jgi:hypothetical protein
MRRGWYLKVIGVREDLIGLIGMAHIFLNAKVGDGHIEMKCGGH